MSAYNAGHIALMWGFYVFAIVASVAGITGGLILVWRELTGAPEGYEDGSGFHTSRPNTASAEAAMARDNSQITTATKTAEKEESADSSAARAGAYPGAYFTRHKIQP